VTSKVRADVYVPAPTVADLRSSDGPGMCRGELENGRTRSGFYAYSSTTTGKSNVR
jgi:hypothetical protein